MDLQSLAKAFTATQVIKNTPAQVKTILPQPTVSKYNNVLDAPPPLRFNFVKSRNFKDQWLLTYDAEMPSAYTRSVIPADINKYFWEHVKANTEPKDLKYLEIFHTYDKQVQLRFLVDKWVADNFHSSGQFHVPATLEWRYPFDIPRIVFVNAQAVAVDLVKYIEDAFLDHVKKHKNILFNDHWRFLKAITPDMFDFHLDRAHMKMRASLKFTVILGSLALYTALYNKSSFTQKQFDTLKTKVSKVSDVTRLDKFLKDYK